MKSVEGACVDINFLVMGMIENNVYIISDDKATIVVDPTSDAEVICKALGDRKLDAIVLTHHHFDHIGAACELREITGALTISSAADAPYIEEENLAQLDFRKTKACTIDHKVSDGDILQIGGMAWKVLATPGHSKGSICLYIAPEFGKYPDRAPVLISGDTLFAGSIGRTDFEGGSMTEMRASLKKLAMLPDNTIVLPGHNEQTTIGNERRRVFATYA